MVSFFSFAYEPLVDGQGCLLEYSIISHLANNLNIPYRYLINYPFSILLNYFDFKA